MTANSFNGLLENIASGFYTETMEDKQRTVQKMPKASIIIPAFNAERYIATTLESILDQSFKDFEILIVDDGSTDKTAARIQQLQDSRIHYYYQPNSGKPSIPRNYAIKHSLGEYIFIFDSDDLMIQGKLQRTVDLLDRRQDAGLLFTGFSCIDEDNEVINSSFLASNATLENLPKTPVDQDAFLIDKAIVLKGLVKSNFLGTSGVAIRKEVFNAVGLFDEEVKNADDAIMWQAVASRFNFIYVPTVYHQYRVRSGSISARKIEERADGIISAMKKMKSFHVGDAESLELLDEKIANYHCQVGYSYFVQYRFADARKALRKSLKTRFSERALYYLMLSCLPPSGIQALKKVKSSIRA